MAGQLWSKGETLDKQIHSFTVGDDHLIDLNLLPFDCIGSAAHVKMLAEVGLIPANQKLEILACLKELHSKAISREILISREQEDCHTAIEGYLTEKLGEAGKRIHVGRSRNDQVLLAMRLYLRAELLEVMQKLVQLGGTLGDRSAELFAVPMPGYTHLQPAMPSSVGLWLHAFLESSLDLLRSANQLQDLINYSPLGVGAGFGVSLPLKRERVAELLGFSGIQRSPIDTQNSRGRDALRVLRLVSDIGTMIEKVSWDMQLGVMDELKFFSLPQQFTTGSSIMPQKRNPDVLELLRGKTGILRGAEDELRWVTAKLPSNYHRDFQLTKGPVIRSIQTVKENLMVLNAVVKNFSVNKEELESAMTPELYATYDAFRLVKSGMPFREAYQATAKKVGERSLDVSTLKSDWEKIRESEQGYLKLGVEELKSWEKKVSGEIVRLNKISSEIFV